MDLLLWRWSDCSVHVAADGGGVLRPERGFGWLLQGAWTVGRPGTELLSLRTAITSAPAYGFLCGLFLRSVTVVGIVQRFTMGVLLLGGALAIGKDWRGLAWQSSGLYLRGALACAEGAAYWVELNPSGRCRPRCATR